MLVVGDQVPDAVADEIGVGLGLGLALREPLAGAGRMGVGHAVVFADPKAVALGVVDGIQHQTLRGRQNG